MPSRPAPRTRATGSVAHGVGRKRPRSTTRTRPPRSLTKMRPSGAKLIAQGAASPDATTSSPIRTGEADAGARGTGAAVD